MKPMNIKLEADDAYPVQAMTELVKQALTCIGEQLAEEPIEFSASDVYWTMQSLLDYVNRHIKGEFALKRLKKGSWSLEYTDSKAAQRKAAARHKRELKRTADYLESLTGRRPKWG